MRQVWWTLACSALLVSCRSPSSSPSEPSEDSSSTIADAGQMRPPVKPLVIPETALIGVLVKTNTGCGKDVMSVRSVANGVTKTTKVNADCEFAIEVTPNEASYIQFVNGMEQVVALLSWLDPTKTSDGITLDLTSFAVLPKGTQHKLGGVGLHNLGEDVANYPGTMRPSFEGAGGLVSAIPENAPLMYDIDQNGFPDQNEKDYPSGSDLDGDGVPNKDTESCIEVSRPLFGRIGFIAYRDDLSPEDVDKLRQLSDELSNDITLTNTGFKLGPIPAPGVWIMMGSQDDSRNMVMADENGDFTLESIPDGIVTARVFKNPGDHKPIMTLSLCDLQTSTQAVNNDTALYNHFLYGNACGMDDLNAATCGEPGPEPAEDDLGHHGHGLHVTCGKSNSRGCCLDYDGNAATAGKPHDTFASIRAYLGSTCERYVKAGCCINELGTIGDIISANANILGNVFGVNIGTPAVTCWRNHQARNCQNIDLGPSGLVLSASKAVRDAHDPSTDVETITVTCNSTTALYHYNNTCQNEDNILLEGCGTLSPQGSRLRHGSRKKADGTIDTQFRNEPNRDLVYTAPSQDCSAIVRSKARGMTRSVKILVQCATPVSRGACCDPNGRCRDGLQRSACESTNGLFSEGQMCSELGCGSCCREGRCIDDVSLEDCSLPEDQYAPGLSCGRLTCNSLKAAVLLDYNLGTNYQAGETITIDRIAGGIESGQDSGCPGSHLHATGSSGIFVDSNNGPYVDQAPTSCGYGRIVYIY